MPIEDLSAQNAFIQAELLALNNAHAEETSHVDEEAWLPLIDRAFAATCFDGTRAFLIAMNPDCSYDNENFLWFRERYDRFAYVDRIIVGEAARGRYAAGALYTDLFARAREAGLERVVCEVNVEPPNPRSQAFHAKHGFYEVGRADLPARGKTVQYLVKDLIPAR